MAQIEPRMDESVIMLGVIPNIEPRKIKPGVTTVIYSHGEESKEEMNWAIETALGGDS